MKKIFLSISVVFLLVMLAGCTAQNGLEDITGQSNSNQTESKAEDADMILFYGRECPHCQEVEEYIAENNLDEKVKFSRLEIYHDKDNAALAVEKAKECGIDENELGVPFLWASGKCYIGGPEVENFLSAQAK